MVLCTNLLELKTVKLNSPRQITALITTVQVRDQSTWRGGGELRGGTSVRGNGEGSVVPRDYYLLTISWSLPTEWKKGTIEYWLPINCHWGGGDQVNLIITPPKSSRSPLPFSSPAIKDHRSLSHFQYDYIIFKFKTDCCPGKLKTNLRAFS